MGMTLDKVMTGARSIIAAATPDVDTTVPFVAAPMNGELESLPLNTPGQGTRKFHVICGVLAGSGGPQPGNWNANEVNHLHDVIVVRVRYHCPLHHGGYGRLNNYLADDSQRIFHALSNANEAAWGGAEYRPMRIDPVGGVSITQIGDGDNADAFILNFPFKLQMILGAS